MAKKTELQHKLEDKNGAIIIRFYNEAVKEIVSTIRDFKPSSNKFNELRGKLGSILNDLDEVNKQYVETALPDDYSKGIEEANAILSGIGVDMSTINKEAHQTYLEKFVDGTNFDLAKNVTALRNGIESAISEAERMKLKEIFSTGIKKRKDEISREIVQTLEERGVQSILDRGGKNWTLESYADMLVRTKKREAFNNGVVNRALENDIVVFRVSFTGTTHEACKKWENVLVSSNEEFGLPSIAEATASGLFHPNCMHILTPDPTAQFGLEDTFQGSSGLF